VHDPPLKRTRATMQSNSMSRYQWLLVALLSANFGVVFFDRNVFRAPSWRC